MSDSPKLSLVLQHYQQWYCPLFSWLCIGSNWKKLGWRNSKLFLYCYFTFSPNIEHPESFIFGGRVTLKSGQRKNWFLRGIYQALVSKTYVLQGFVAIKYWDEKVKGQLWRSCTFCEFKTGYLPNSSNYPVVFFYHDFTYLKLVIMILLSGMY